MSSHLQLSSTATAPSSSTAPWTPLEPSASARAKLIEKRQLYAQQYGRAPSSTASGATSSEDSLTTYSNSSLPEDPTKQSSVQLGLDARLDECCRGSGGRSRGGGSRVHRWSDEDPEVESDSSAWESMGSFALTETAEEDQQGLVEVMKEAGLWSAGSAKHMMGKCRPCHYVRGNTGCEKGQACEFCHFPHMGKSGKSRRQHSMCARLYCKSFGDALVVGYSSRPDQLGRAAAIASRGNDYLASILKDRIERLEGSPAEVTGRRKHIVSL